MDIIELKNIEKKYGDKIIFDNLNLSIKKNSITGLIGGNGEGKTTTMKIILGLTPFSSGEIYFNGKKISYSNKDENVFNKFGYMIDNRYDPNLTLYDNLKAYSILNNISNYEEKISYLIKLVGLEKEKKKFIQKFSSGMKQRYDFILSIINDPEILFLDEPFANLDPIAIDIFKKAIKEIKAKRECTILINSHNLHDIETMCSDVLVLSKGKVSIDKKIEQMISLVYIITFENKIKNISNKIKSICEDVTLSDDGMSLLVKNPIKNFFVTLEDETKGNRVVDVQIDKQGLERYFGYEE